MTPTRYAIALHGGAGTMARGDPTTLEPYHAALRTALDAGIAVLATGGTALDAVVATVVALEEAPLFNAGRGAVFTAAEAHELDAGVMCGATLAAGAVAGVRRLRNPVLAARALAAEGRVVLMGGDAADRWGEAQGLVVVDPAWFSTPQRRAQLRAVRARDAEAALLDHDGAARPEVVGEDKMGTVGAVALDHHGHLAAATSTGGMTNKRPGRIGDTPIVGAGVYANDASCAVSTTGTGEHFIRGCIAHDVHARIAYGGAGLGAAARAAIDESLAPIGGRGGLVAVDRQGRIVLPFNSAGMYRAWAREGEAPVSAVFD